jgi:hypothetical protein
MRKPGVMVSSTCYDLSEVRAGLRAFIDEDLGYRSLLSEYPTFPVDPDASTIENCRRRVAEDADILILVVGGRYGSIDPGTKRSVTNLEYLAARAKGIPVFAFVQKQILAMVPIWKANPTADFRGSVDSVELFRFVEELAGITGVWVRPFELGTDIISAVREQLAYLFGDALEIRRRLGSPARYLDELRGDTLRLAIERPPGWEFLLFFSRVADRIDSCTEMRQEHLAGLAIGLGEDVIDAPVWLGLRLNDLERLSGNAHQVFNSSVMAAAGPAGQSGDAAALVYSGDAVGAVYRNLLLWRRRVLTANLSEERFEAVQKALGSAADDLLDELENFTRAALEQIRAVLLLPKGDPGRQLILDFTARLRMRRRCGRKWRSWRYEWRPRHGEARAPFRRPLSRVRLRRAIPRAR